MYSTVLVRESWFRVRVDVYSNCQWCVRVWFRDTTQLVRKRFNVRAHLPLVCESEVCGTSDLTRLKRAIMFVLKFNC